MTSGANCIADENVKPHMRIPSSPSIMKKSPVCTGTLPRSRQWIAPFANLPRVLTPEISGEGAKQLDKRVSSTPKGPHCTMTSCRRAPARSEARRSQSDHSRDQVVVALVVRTPKSLHYMMTPRRPTHIVGHVSSVLILTIYRLSN